jgi:hypothetical protein
VCLPPNEEQAGLGVVGLAVLKTFTGEFVANNAFCSEKEWADFCRFKRILQRRTVRYEDGTEAEVKWLAL